MLRINLVVDLDTSHNQLKAMVAKKLRLSTQEIKNFSLFRRSIDARKGTVKFNYTLDFSHANEDKLLAKNKFLSQAQAHDFVPKKGPTLADRPLVIGFGPSGMFAAYYLALAGLKPMIFERGQRVEDRAVAVDHFWKTGHLDESSNVQFGEGGAGTFSDGKLTTRIKDPRSRYVFEVLVEHGAPKDILLDQKPHVGTDLLIPLVKSMRQRIEDLGGTFYFEEGVTDLVVEEGQIKGVVTNKRQVSSSAVFLGVGHSARDTFDMLYKRGLAMVAKPFAMGLRIEHPRDMIDTCQYGSYKTHHQLGAADYSVKAQAHDRSVYSFCMCPGGYVVNASSEQGHLVVNGMSYHSRTGENSNSAILVSVSPKDFGSDHPLAGMWLQRELESKAFEQTGSFVAPVQTLGDFLLGQTSKALGQVQPTIKPGYSFTDFNTWLPAFMTGTIKTALPIMGKQIKGFDREDALLTGVETRSSSPIRMVRGSDYVSESIKGLYPMGEGAGYAGGITSSAVDGLAAVDAFITSHLE